MPEYLNAAMMLISSIAVLFAIIWIVVSVHKAKVDHLNLAQELSKQVTDERQLMRREFQMLLDNYHSNVASTVASTNHAIGQLRGEVSAARSEVGALGTDINVDMKSSLENLHAKVDAIVPDASGGTKA